MPPKFVHSWDRDSAAHCRSSFLAPDLSDAVSPPMYSYDLVSLLLDLSLTVTGAR